MLSRHACLIAASVSIFYVSSSLPAQSDAEMRSSVKRFTQVLDAVESNFADKLDTEQSMYKGAIPGMLRTLDPHSSFFDPKANELFRENQAGRYFGVGMFIWAPEGKVLVSYPFVGSPAFRAGLHPGDLLVSVTDRNTEKMTIPEVSDLLNGQRPTPAQLVAPRCGPAAPPPLHGREPRDRGERDGPDGARQLRHRRYRRRDPLRARPMAAARLRALPRRRILPGGEPEDGPRQAAEGAEGPPRRAHHPRGPRLLA